MEICKKQKDIYRITNTVYSCLYFGGSIYFSYSPDLLGGLLGWITAPLCRLLEKRLHLSHKRAALCTAVAVYSVSLVLLALLFTRLIRESAAFFASGRYFRYEALAPAVRSFLERTWQELPQWVSAAQKNFSGNMGAAMPALQGTVKAISLLPAVFLTLMLIPVFAYLTLLYRENLLSLLKKLIGEKCVETLQKSAKSESSVGFVSAYALIYTITFAESFVMLHLLRMEYPLMTAAVVTVSDIFPVLGPGTRFAAARRLPIVMRQRGASTRAFHRMDHSKRHSADH